MKKINKILLAAFCGVIGFSSCADLEPEFSDVITESTYFANDDAFISALGSAYTNLYAMQNHGNIFSLDAVSSDEAAVPHKGPDWEDGGQWLRTHRHDFSDGEGVFNNVWTWAYGGINTCNRLIATFEGQADNPNSAGFIAELKVLRAFYYLNLVDIFGNVPLVESFDVPDGFLPATEPRSNIYAFVKTELEANVPLLTDEVSAGTYARVNRNVGNALLATLYMNSEEWVGTAEWDKAIAASDAIINSGSYSLESNYFDNFSIDNAGSKENIWVIPYDAVNAGGFNLVQMTLHYESQKTFDLNDQPWNGYTALADLYNSFESNDIRITGGGRGYGVLLEGPQFDRAGNQLIDNDDKWYPDNEVDGVGRAVNFSAEINELAPGAWRDGGTRLSKYEYQIGSTNTMSNDFAIYRYAEVLLNKAEAMWRKNPSSGEALELVNMVRARAGVDAFTELTNDNFLAERGRELCFEIKRRADLIRFGEWTSPWWEKGATQDFKKLMPIPAGQISVNSNLQQNPGY